MVAYRRKMATRRTARSRKRTPIVRRTRAIQPKIPVMSFKRTVYTGNWQFGAAATTNFWRYTFLSMDLLPNLAEYQALFDQYRINGCRVQFRPKWDGADAGPSGSSGQSMVYATIFKDPLSIVTPAGTYSSTTYNTFLEHGNGNVITRRCDKPFAVYYKPMTPSADIAANGRYLTSPWLSLANATSAQHKGFHVFLNDANFAANSTLSFDLVITLYFQCRGNR